MTTNKKGERENDETDGPTPEGGPSSCPNCGVTGYEPTTACRDCGLEPEGHACLESDQGDLLANQSARSSSGRYFAPRFNATVPVNRLDRNARSGTPDHFAYRVCMEARAMFGQARADRWYNNRIFLMLIRPLTEELKAAFKDAGVVPPKDAISSFSRSRKGRKKCPDGLTTKQKISAITIALAWLEDELFSPDATTTEIDQLSTNAGIRKKTVIEAKSAMRKVVQAAVKAGWLQLNPNRRFWRLEAEASRLTHRVFDLVDHLIEEDQREHMRKQITTRVDLMEGDGAHPAFWNTTVAQRWAMATWAAFQASPYLEGNRDDLAGAFHMKAEGLAALVRSKREEALGDQSLGPGSVRTDPKLDRENEDVQLPLFDEREVPEHVRRFLQSGARKPRRTDEDGSSKESQ